MTDWLIGFYESAGETDTTRLQAMAEAHEWEEPVERYFGGVKSKCYRTGVHGEYTEICLVDHTVREGLVVVREWIDADVTYTDTPGITPIKMSDAWYARIRQSMEFLSY